MQCIDCIGLDMDIYNSIFSNSSRVKDQVTLAKNTMAEFEYLSADIYLALFKEEVLLKSVDQVTSGQILQHGFIRKILEIYLIYL